MQNAATPTGRQFRQRFLLVTLAMSGGAVVLIAAYLVALLMLTPEQWRGFAVIVAGLFVVLFVAQDRVNRRLWEPIVSCLDRLREGQATLQELRAGFEQAVNLPARGQRIGLFWWTLGGVLVAGSMKACFAGFSWFSALVMLVAATTGGHAMSIFHFFVTKRIAEPVRNALALGLGGLGERRALVQHTPLYRKLRFSITGVTISTVLFAILCAQARSVRPVEAHATRVQTQILARAAERFGWDGELGLRSARDEMRSMGVAEDVLIVDADARTVVSGDAALLSSGELALLFDAGVEVGDSTGFDSPHVFAWRRIPQESRYLVAASSWAGLRTVPAPTMAPGTCAMSPMARMATGVRRVTSSTGRPAPTRVSASAFQSPSPSRTSTGITRAKRMISSIVKVARRPSPRAGPTRRPRPGRHEAAAARTAPAPCPPAGAASSRAAARQGRLRPPRAGPALRRAGSGRRLRGPSSRAGSRRWRSG